MSYIEKKYRDKITEIFEGDLPQWEGYLLELFNKKSLKISDNVAKVCGDINKSINHILKQYYPEIKDMSDKLEIKSILKFYYDLIDKLTNFIRNIDNFQKIDDNDYNIIIDFIKDKKNLISGKYRLICKQELTAFYDPKSRDNLEQILAEKFEIKSRQFFTIGSLEEEVKKIACVAGAEKVIIEAVREENKNKQKTNSIESTNSVITYSTSIDDAELLIKIGEELKDYLESKGYYVKIMENSVITNAQLLPDDK